MAELHSALRTEQVAQVERNSVDAKVVRLQWDKDRVAYGLHVRPKSWSGGGIQTTDFLRHLGFQRCSCAFFRNECYARQVNWPFDLEGFAAGFTESYTALVQSERHLDACGMFLDYPEGIGFFSGSASHGYRRHRGSPDSDGHTAALSKRMNQSTDDSFDYVLTWIEGGNGKGWTTHYHPLHPPLSVEVRAAFGFLGLESFTKCPEFDFEECYYRFTTYEGDPNSGRGSDADVAHGWFGAHAEHFSPGVESILAVDLAVQPFGMNILPRPAVSGYAGPREPGEVMARISDRKGQSSTQHEYDVAISYAGPQRPLAGGLARIVSEAGFRVFYDVFYPEQLWGKDLGVLFDRVYRKASRFCVVFVSSEYRERIWTSHEWRSAVARAIEEKGGEYILPVKVDATELDGMAPTIGYLGMDRYTIEQIGQILVRKLRGEG